MCADTLLFQASRFALALAVMVLASAVHGLPSGVAKLEAASDDNGYSPELVIEAPGKAGFRARGVAFLRVPRQAWAKRKGARQ